MHKLSMFFRWKTYIHHSKRRRIGRKYCHSIERTVVTAFFFLFHKSVIINYVNIEQTSCCLTFYGRCALFQSQVRMSLIAML